MAAKSKEKKEKGKKAKHKTEKVRLESQADVAMPPIPVAPQLSSALAAKALKTGSDAAISTSDAILDAAIECVATGGIEGLTTRRIAAQAGVNEVTIFRRFGSKDGLLDAVFAREAARIKAGAVQYSSNLEADLVRIVTIFVEALVRRAGVLPILVEAVQQRPEVRGAAQYSLAAFAEVAGVLERYMREGKLRREPPQQTLAALVGPLVFAALLGGAAGARVEIDVQQHVERFLFGRAVTGGKALATTISR